MTADPDLIDELAEVEDAEAAAAAALADVTRLEDALLDGEVGVTAADVVAAQRTAEERGAIAKLARSFRERRTTRVAEAQRLARIDALDQLIRERFGEHEAGIVKAYDAAVTALEKLIGRVGDHNQGLLEIVEELLRLGPLPQHLQLSVNGSLHLPRVDVFIEPIDAKALAVGAAQGAAVPADFEHGRPDAAHRIRRTAAVVAERGTGR